MLHKYYTDMKAHSSGKDFICFFLSGLTCWKIYLYEEII